jgi:hypothetical protein
MAYAHDCRRNDTPAVRQPRLLSRGELLKGFDEHLELHARDGGIAADPRCEHLAFNAHPCSQLLWAKQCARAGNQTLCSFVGHDSIYQRSTRTVRHQVTFLLLNPHTKRLPPSLCSANQEIPTGGWCGSRSVWRACAQPYARSRPCVATRAPYLELVDAAGIQLGGVVAVSSPKYRQKYRHA